MIVPDPRRIVRTVNVVRRLLIQATGTRSRLVHDGFPALPAEPRTMPPADPPAPNADAQRELQAARQLVAARRFADAEQAYRRVLALHPEDAEGLHFLGAAAAQRGDLDDAVNLLSRASRAVPANFDVLVELGIVYRKAERFDAARYTLERATRLGAARNPGIRLVLADLLEADRRPDLALLHYCRATMQAQQLRRWNGDNGIGYELERLVPQASRAIVAGRRAWFDRALASAREGAAACDRIDEAVALHLGERPFVPSDPRQRAGFMAVPRLRATPFPDPSSFAWLAQAATLGGFAAEAEACLDAAGAGDAGVFQLRLHARGLVQYEAHRHAPGLNAAIEALPLANIPNHAPDVSLLALRPGARTPPESGVSNARCQVLVNLDGGDAIEVVVGGEARLLACGEALAIDPSLGVEYRHAGAARARLLALDAWHPDLTQAERRALSAAIVAALDFDARLQELDP